MKDKQVYYINEIYYTLHGEGVQVGQPFVFVRMAYCNLTCNFCDTEFESGNTYKAEEVVAEATRAADAAYQPVEPKKKVEGAKYAKEQPVDKGPCRSVLFCGGEPLLQLDAHLVAAFKAAGWYISVETNGTAKCPDNVDWITCSPKVAEHAIALSYANEMKYVRAAGQAIPRPAVKADHYLLSPMFEGNEVPQATMDWCVALVKANPGWRLTAQAHKFWRVR